MFQRRRTEEQERRGEWSREWSPTPPLPSWLREVQLSWKGLEGPCGAHTKQPHVDGRGDREGSVPSRPQTSVLPHQAHRGEGQRPSAHCVWPSDPFWTEYEPSPCLPNGRPRNHSCFILLGKSLPTASPPPGSSPAQPSPASVLSAPPIAALSLRPPHFSRSVLCPLICILCTPINIGPGLGAPTLSSLSLRS